MQIVGTATEESWPGVTRLPEYNTGKCVNYRDVICRVCSICGDPGAVRRGSSLISPPRPVRSPLRVNLAQTLKKFDKTVVVNCLVVSLFGGEIGTGKLAR